MSRQIDRLANKIADDKPALGAYTHDPDMVELMAHIGFDWFLIDQMFSANDWSKTQQLMRAGEAAGITPVVRVQSNPWLGYDHGIAIEVTRALGVGTRYVAISYSCKKEVEECAQVTHDWHQKALNIHAFESLEEWDRQPDGMHLIPGAESLSAVECFEEVMAIPEVTFFSFSMTDASRRMAGGKKPDFYSPELWKLVDRGVEIGKQNGVTMAGNTSYAYSMEEIAKRVEKLHAHGVRMILTQGAPFLFQVAVGSFLKDVKKRIGA